MSHVQEIEAAVGEDHALAPQLCTPDSTCDLGA
jgi:hypothetical protein